MQQEVVMLMQMFCRKANATALAGLIVFGAAACATPSNPTANPTAMATASARSASAAASTSSASNGAPAATSAAAVNDEVPCLKLSGVTMKWEDDIAKKRVAACREKCDGGNLRSCAWLADAYEGVKRDHTKARAIRDKACTAGSGLACLALADVIHRSKKRVDQDQKRVPGLVTRAAKLLDEQCKRGEPWSCGDLSSMEWLVKKTGLPLEDGTTIAKSPEPPALCSMERSWCERGYGQSCFEYARICSSSDDEKRVFAVKACDLRYGPGCRFVSELASSIVESEEFMSKACKYGTCL